MIFSRLTFGFLLVTVAAFFCAQSVEAAKGPRISHKVYFDIEQGGNPLCRGTWQNPTRAPASRAEARAPLQS